jgi:L-fuconolactonase
VGWVDLCSPELPQQLELITASEKLVGVRHVIHDEPDEDFMLRPDFLKGIEQLQKYDLAYDILIFPRHLPNTLQFVKTFPDQVFILDHIAKPDIKSRIFGSWKENIIKLGKHPNVFCKLSGMVTEADWKGWKQEDFTSCLDVVLENFGASRVMIGSDWPVCNVAGSYSDVMGIVRSYTGKLTSSEQNLVLGENAIRVYKLID